MNSFIQFIFITLFCGHLCWAQSGESESLETQKALDSQVIQQEEVSEQLSQFKSELESQIKKKEELSEEAQAQSLKTSSALEKSLADYLSYLQTYHSELLEVKLARVKELEDSLRVMREKSGRLTKLEDKLNQIPQEIRLSDLETASSIWRQIVDETLDKLFESSVVEIEDAKAPPEATDLSTEKYEDLRSKITKTKADIENEVSGIRQDFQSLRESEREVRTSLLLNSGRVRSHLMIYLIEGGEYSAWSFIENDPRDYVREVQIVPYKFIAALTEKYFEYKSLMLEGPKGWLSILKQSVLLAFILALPFLIFSVFKRFSVFLSETRRNIFTKSSLDYRSRTRLALWIGRLNPYLPWVFAYITILIARNGLRGSMVDPLLIFLPYVSIYVGYRIFRLAFSSLLAKVLLSKNLNVLRNSQTKVERTAHFFSIIFFIELAVLHATQDAVRRALIYNIIFDFIYIFNVLLVCNESRKWKEELTDLAKLWMPEGLLAWMKKTDFILVEFVIYPLIFVLNMAYVSIGWAAEWLGQFDIGKQLLSELFRKRLEDAVEETGSIEGGLPSSYRDLFLDSEVEEAIRVSVSRSPLKTCVQKVEDWRRETKSDDLLLIYGNFGIGKSTLLKSLESKLKAELGVKFISICERIVDSSSLFELLSHHLGTEIKSAQGLEEWDRSAPKTVIILDDIHKLFLNDVDGLSAYRSLINLTSLQLENVFWCLSCDERAKAHLCGIFGHNHFIGEQIELHSWADSEIQELIMKRHRQSKMRLKFDQIIGAVHRGDILESSSGLEVQFFRMLWGQSRGNPKTAQELWLTATYLKRASEVGVTVPDFTNAKDLSEFGDQALLLFAGIAKHESLKYWELVKVTGVPESHIKQALKLGEDGSILQKMPNGAWRIHPKAQYVVHAQLAGRNLIYG